MLGRAGRLTPAGLRSAIARAVIEVAPDKARERREKAEGDARVEQWAEASGNAGLAGRELPPAEVMAADQRITRRARQLKKAGLAGSMDELRGRAYLDLLLGTDSRPRENAAASQDTSAGNGEPRDGAPGARPAGFAGKVNLTIPLATLLGLAERPGEIPGLGPIDPGLARDLANAAAQNPTTTWCVTVTDEHGPRYRPRLCPARAQEPQQPPRGTQETRAAGRTRSAPQDQGRARVRLHRHRLARATRRRIRQLAADHRVSGRRDLLVTLDPIPAGECDHRYQARGHDPGVKLRHLTQIRNATCTGPGCRRPAVQCDFEHNIPYEAGGRTCLCNGGPKCRTTIGSNSTPGGRPSNSPAAPSGGPPHPDASTPPNPPATRSNGSRQLIPRAPPTHAIHLPPAKSRQKLPVPAQLG